MKGTAGADPDAEAAVAAHGGVLVHANDLEVGAAGTSTGNIVRWACTANHWTLSPAGAAVPCSQPQQLFQVT